MSSTALCMSSIDITFTNETTRSTFRSVIHEIRRVFGVRVVYINNRDVFAEFSAAFEGLLKPDLAPSLYSRRLSKKARKYIESMEIHAIPSPTTHAAAERKSSISINATDGTTRSMFADVVREITRKLGVQAMYTNFDSAMFEGPISSDEVFMQYSRKLSKKALGSITLSAENTGQPTMPDMISRLSQLSEVSDPNMFLELIREMLDQDALRGFRIDAPVPLVYYRDPLGLGSRRLWNERSRSWDELQMRWPDRLPDDKQ